MTDMRVGKEGGAGVTYSIELGPAENVLIAGTIVLTLDGALPVEYLSPQDRVITRDAGAVRVAEVHRARRLVPRVGVAAGSLGTTRPNYDVVVHAYQQVLVRDWRAQALFGAPRALVPASRLVDGTFVRRLPDRMVQTVALVFDTPHILYADGLELASAEMILN